MNKKEACHILAEINEQIYEIENSLSDIESRIRWDDESRRDWYLERKAELIIELKKHKQEHDEFIRKYSDIIYS